MSLSNPTRSTNPAKKFIQYSGDKGKWFYFDKSKGEDGENVYLDLPAYFIILDELTTITGWSDNLQSYIYSNEIHQFDETLKVKSFKGGLNIVGLYPDIKSEIKQAGGKYCKSVYAMYFDTERNKELVNLKFYGSSLSPFIELKIKPEKSILVLKKETVKAKKGSNEYLIPVLGTFKMDEKLLTDAIEMDKELQIYLKQYKKSKTGESIEQEEQHPDWDEEPPGEELPPVDSYNESENQPEDSEDDLPF